MAEQFIHIYYRDEWNSKNFAFYCRLTTFKPISNTHIQVIAFELGEYFGKEKKQTLRKKRSGFLRVHIWAYFIVMCSFYTCRNNNNNINNKRAGFREGEKAKSQENTRIFIVNNSLYSILQLPEYAILWNACAFRCERAIWKRKSVDFGFSLFSHNFSFILPFSCFFPLFRMVLFCVFVFMFWYELFSSHHIIPADCVLLWNLCLSHIFQVL